MSKTNSITGLLAALVLTVIAGTGCEGCEEKPHKEPEPDTSDIEPTEPQEDPLAGAADEAEDSATSAAIHVSDVARYLAGDMEAIETPDQDLPSQKPPPPRESSGSIPAAKLNEVFDNHRGEARDCYERQLKANPNLAGRIILTLTINSAGSVSRSRAVGDTLVDGEVADCIESKSRRWSFPKPEGGEAKVRKPMSFSPKR